MNVQRVPASVSSPPSRPRPAAQPAPPKDTYQPSAPDPFGEMMRGLRRLGKDFREALDDPNMARFSV